MGTQTMGSNGGGRKSSLGGLSRQGSLYNLTLDEVQQQLGDLGKPFSSMNLDELLKSVYTAEANQGTSGSGNGNGNGPNYTELTQLDSVVTKKTVDEVWQDIQQGQNRKKKIVSDDDGEEDDDDDGEDDDYDDDSFKNGDRKRQATLGEMTLEDFLVKAGIVAESSLGKKNDERGGLERQENQWLNYQTIQQQNVIMAGHYQAQQPLSVTGNSLMDVGYMSPAPLMVGGFSERHLSGRKRFASGDVMEKTVERRQKRMIKNRESAARSRARKQAYTQELENKVSRLEEENERLRKEKEVEKVIPWVPPPKPKYQLRRTSSARF
ncbi:hypothetical protein SSX86_015114 [Deinandra increscens subsp. villosa]|uniref:BZIP domain-containing protein n=1 Tax=Deinandra increscens subsp. villosa TaxID=3103831 RepID=A0AAP0GWB0_9ASTR